MLPALLCKPHSKLMPEVIAAEQGEESEIQASTGTKFVQLKDQVKISKIPVKDKQAILTFPQPCSARVCNLGVKCLIPKSG